MVRQKVRRSILFFSFFIFPITFNYLSFILMIEGASKGIATTSVLFWSLWFVSSLFIGRVACGYICPFGGVQMVVNRVAPRKLRKIKHLRAVKYVLFVTWISLFVFFLVLAGGYEKIDFLYNTPNVVAVDSPQMLVVYYSLMAVVLLPMLLGKRGFCQYFCFLGVLSIIGTKIKNFLRMPSLHLRADKGKCADCKSCDSICPMSIEVSRKVQSGSMSGTECILCGSCVDNCKNRVIQYSFSCPNKIMQDSLVISSDPRLIRS
ncbi:MAG: 4Fe-4S binding protein [Actinobacteria bacterium]|nr:4Fe-4S binding protein [Actinomycetota bacterium]